MVIAEVIDSPVFNETGLDLGLLTCLLRAFLTGLVKLLVARASATGAQQDPQAENNKHRRESS
jgi:hypothetical protein